MCTAAAAIFFARFYTWKRKEKNLVGNVQEKAKEFFYQRQGKAKVTRSEGPVDTVKRIRTDLSLLYSAPCHFYLFHNLSKKIFLKNHTHTKNRFCLLPSEAQQIVA
jgi:hypothetical protein